MEVVKYVANLLWGTPLIVLILIAGLLFTLGSKFFQVGHFGHIMKNTIGKLLKRSPEEKAGKGRGMMRPLEVISIAVGGAVGVGNIGGVATAIAVGGPGAAFWIWISAFLGMMMKMAEVSLAVYYRSKDEKGGYYGGPTYYMQKGLGRDRNFKPWAVLAVIFGVGIFGNVFSMQNFTVSQAVNATFGIPMIAISLVYVALTYLATVREIPWLGKVASVVVPPMCLFYLAGGILIIVMNVANLPATLALIVKSAFTPTAASGAFLGAGVAMVIRTGFARAMFSNEAGWGTSPMIHASAKTEHPVKQGLWGAFEVFVDTMLVCTVTALVIIITGKWNNGLDGPALTLSAFESVLGPVGTVIITLGVLLFGLSTTSGWWAYFEVLLRHLCGKREKLKQTLINVFKVIYPIPGFLVVLLYVLGNDVSGADIWAIADLTTGIPAFVNLIVIICLSGKFFQLLRDYKARYMGIGTVDPDFKLFDEDEQAAKAEAAAAKRD